MATAGITRFTFSWEDSFEEYAQVLAAEARLDGRVPPLFGARPAALALLRNLYREPSLSVS